MKRFLLVGVLAALFPGPVFAQQREPGETNATLASLVDSTFLLIPGEELTSSFESLPVLD